MYMSGRIVCYDDLPLALCVWMYRLRVVRTQMSHSSKDIQGSHHRKHSPDISHVECPMIVISSPVTEDMFI